MNSEVIAKISRDVAGDRGPDASYTEEMKDAYDNIKAEFEAFKKKHPKAVLHIPAGIEGLPGDDKETG